MIAMAHGRVVEDRKAFIFSAVLNAIKTVQPVDHLGMLDVDDWVFGIAGKTLCYLLYRKLCIRPIASR